MIRDYASNIDDLHSEIVYSKCLAIVSISCTNQVGWII